MKSKSEMKRFIFWVKISIFIKNNPKFSNLPDKVFKIYSFFYLVLNLMLHYSTYTYSVVFTYKIFQIFFSFASKTDIFIIRYILGNACFAIS